MDGDVPSSRANAWAMAASLAVVEGTCCGMLNEGMDKEAGAAVAPCDGSR